MIRLLLAVLLLSLSAASSALAAETVYPFETPQQEVRFDRLTSQLRCLVCQGQSIDDSGSRLAQDMRDKVFELIAAGRSDQEVINFMTARYGDFVLFRPPMEPKTWLLWFGPFLLIAVGVSALLIMIRRRRTRAQPTGLDDEERQRLTALLASDNKGDR